MSGNPEYDRYAKARFRAQTERGPGTEHRRLHPATTDLTEGESMTLRRITNRYERRSAPFGRSTYANVTRESLPESDRQNVDTLEGLGFVRVEEDGRIVPSFVFQEHPRRGTTTSKEQPEHHGQHKKDCPPCNRYTARQKRRRMLRRFEKRFHR